VKTVDVGKVEKEKQRQYLLSQKLSLYQIPESINCDKIKSNSFTKFADRTAVHVKDGLCEVANLSKMTPKPKVDFRHSDIFGAFKVS
jgi:hypothetical protein